MPEHPPPSPSALDEPIDWLGSEELPPRPRRKLLSPLPVSLLLVLMLACGFIAGVLVQKHQGSASASGGTSALAGRFAALRSASRAGTSPTGSTGSGSPATSGKGSALGLPGATGSSATVGEVSFVRGSTLYVTDAEGGTVKVLAKGATVSKTVSTSTRAIHPGETVIVSGSKAKSGAIQAQTIRVGATGGGLGSLLGGASAPSATGSGSSSAGAGGPALFGSEG
jgi:hypothetical protein